MNLTTYRAYNPTLGRWINRDPIEEAGGDNLYAYVDNAPIANTDPSGYACNKDYPCCKKGDTKCCVANLATCLKCHPKSTLCCYAAAGVCHATVTGDPSAPEAFKGVYPGSSTWALCKNYPDKKPGKGGGKGSGAGGSGAGGGRMVVPGIPFIFMPISPDPQSQWYPGHYGVSVDSASS